jgi:hypothetical protein
MLEGLEAGKHGSWKARRLGGMEAGKLEGWKAWKLGSGSTWAIADSNDKEKISRTCLLAWQPPSLQAFMLPGLPDDQPYFFRVSSMAA